MKRCVILLVLLISTLGIHPTKAQDTPSCPGAPPSRLVIGERGRVTPGPANNVRSQPSTQSESVGQVPGEGFFRVLDGPVCGEGMAWWQIESGAITGWTAEGAADAYWLEPLPRITPENAAQVQQIASLGRDGGFKGWMPDNQTLIMSSSGGVLLIDYEHFQVMPRIIGQNTGEAAFSTDQTLLATADLYRPIQEKPDPAECTIKLWDVTSGKLLHELQGHTDYISGYWSGLSFSPDGTLLRSWNEVDGTLVWDVVTGKRLISPQGYTQVLDFSLDGNLYVLDVEGSIWLWDARQGQIVGDQPLLRPIEANLGQTHSFEFSPDRTRMIITDSNHNVPRLWDLNTGTWIHTLRGYYIVSDWEVGWVVTSDYPDMISIWDTNTGQLVTSFQLTYPEEEARLYVPDHVTFSPNHQLLALEGGVEWCAGSVSVWDVSTGESLFYQDGGCVSVLFTPTNDLLMASGRGIQRWYASTGKVETLSGGVETFIQVAFSAGGDLLAASDSYGNIHVWDAISWTELKTIFSQGAAFDFSPAGTWIAYLGARASEHPGYSSEWDQSIHLRNPKTGEEKTIAYNEAGNPSRLAFSPDGTILGTGPLFGSQADLHFWDVTTGEKLSSTDPAVQALLVPKPWLAAFSEAGYYDFRAVNLDRTLVAFQCDQDFCLFDTVSGEITRTLESVPGEITSAAFSPDGRLLAATTGEYGYDVPGRLYLWEVATGTLLAAPEGHVGSAWDVAFSPDGTLIISAGGGCYQCEGDGWDNVLRMWAVPVGN